MTTRVITVRKDASYKEIATRLRENRVSAFPVIDDENRVVGVVSGTDLLAKEALPEAGDEPHLHLRLSRLRHARERRKARGLVAADLMSAPAVTISPDDPVSQAAQLMLARRVRRLPVVGADGRLAGIVSRADVLAVFSRPDDDICREITRDVIMDGFFMDPAQFTVTVADGIVTLEGSPDTAVVADCIVEQVRHMEGVVAVRERLTQQAS